MTIEFSGLSRQRACVDREIQSAISRVMEHGRYIMGPEVLELEDAFRDFVSSRYAITCANGTDALTLALLAWDVGPGDAVFVPDFTYVASAASPALLGATPIFVDTKENEFGIDAESLATAISDASAMGLRPSVVVPVDLFGIPTDIGAVKEVVERHGVRILVDGAQSFGAGSGSLAFGKLGDVTTTSFFPNKPLGCYGDGGAIFTNDRVVAEKIMSLRQHGRGTTKYNSEYRGFNSRLDTLQAAILMVKLKVFQAEITQRQNLADLYRRQITNKSVLPKVDKASNPVWAQFTIRTSKRDILRDKLRKAGIPTEIYYPVRLSDQNGFKDFPVVSSGTPNALRHTKLVVSLPLHPYLSEKEIKYITDEVNKYV